MNDINDIIAIGQFLIARYTVQGDTVVDATAGNGWDTLFLAKLVGPQGCVHAFDIQEVALKNTRTLLQKEGLWQRVSLHLVSHRDMGEIVSGTVKAIMFNLGYLPGSNKEITTTPEDTLAALRCGSHILAPGGIITVITYPGHYGGKEEATAVANWCRRLSGEYTVMSMDLKTKNNCPPGLWVIKKNKKVNF